MRIVDKRKSLRCKIKSPTIDYKTFPKRFQPIRKTTIIKHNKKSKYFFLNLCTKLTTKISQIIPNLCLSFQKDIAIGDPTLRDPSLYLNCYIQNIALYIPDIDFIRYTCPQHQYKAILIGTPNHVSIALVDYEKKVIEIFDSSGKHDFYSRIIIAIEKLFPKDYLVIYVNENFLQQEDALCQTWIFYYLYNRLSLKKTSAKIVRSLRKMTPMQRFDEIMQFWYFMMQS